MDKQYKVALDDGHGMETPGKRTPRFADGSFMHENEFNRRVVELLAIELKRSGIQVLLVAPGDRDVPLSERTTAANMAGADLYLSVHANAYGDGSFNGTSGVETLYKPGNISSAQFAEILQRRLVKGTKQTDRGLKERNDLHVLNATRMPAALVECGFMTNSPEATLLRSDSFRKECASELAQGVCEYFGITYQGEVEEVNKAKTIINGQPAADAILLENSTYIKVSELKKLGINVEWDNITKTVSLTK
ncbi:N-acetylmuramoyl-L-alanine amidase family protein [Paenibacillus silvisoli]|uniref:N-acetylmuramoyl-L-alanine amidase family protein n=1 Tax=Paenibacillus silvisoli TaxID=3110539 RepID=UPI0028060FDB|nr:N-acetylmuramoyl-L-alanine amidase [Paenibacillus silvisoli]